MKIARNAQQKNVVLDRDYYTDREICDMLGAGEIFFFLPGGRISHDPEEGLDREVRIFTDNLVDIKVVLEDGYYATVATDKAGRVHHVKLT